MKVACSTCKDKLSVLSVTPRPDGTLECGGCNIKRKLPGVSLNQVRLVSLTDPPPIRSVFFWLLETQERN